MVRCTEGAVLTVLDEAVAQRAAQFFKIFGDAGRIRMLMLLKDREVCVNHLADELGMTISAVSHQLRMLRQEHLVRYIKDGKKVFYTLDDEHVSSLLEEGFEHLRHKGEIK